MFSKAARFNAIKPSDVPGPGSYDPVDFDAVFSQKKGAFLEKSDRFGEEKMSDIPGKLN